MGSDTAGARSGKEKKEKRKKKKREETERARKQKEEEREKRESQFTKRSCISFDFIELHSISFYCPSLLSYCSCITDKEEEDSHT